MSHEIADAYLLYCNFYDRPVIRCVRACAWVCTVVRMKVCVCVHVCACVCVHVCALVRTCVCPNTMLILRVNQDRFAMCGQLSKYYVLDNTKYVFILLKWTSIIPQNNVLSVFFGTVYRKWMIQNTVSDDEARNRE